MTSDTVLSRPRPETLAPHRGPHRDPRSLPPPLCTHPRSSTPRPAVHPQVRRRVLFAGEHTLKEHPDTVGGAMLSGLREAVHAVQLIEGLREAELAEGRPVGLAQATGAAAAVGRKRKGSRAAAAAAGGPPHGPEALGEEEEEESEEGGEESGRQTKSAGELHDQGASASRRLPAPHPSAASASPWQIRYWKGCGCGTLLTPPSPPGIMCGGRTGAEREAEQGAGAQGRGGAHGSW